MYIYVYIYICIYTQECTGKACRQKTLRSITRSDAEKKDNQVYVLTHALYIKMNK